jgi:hypothetical protein
MKAPQYALEKRVFVGQFFENYEKKFAYFVLEL